MKVMLEMEMYGYIYSKWRWFKTHIWNCGEAKYYLTR